MIFDDLHKLVAQLEADASLFAPAQLRRRIDALDELDAHFGGIAEVASTPTQGSPDPGVIERATALRSRLEAANTEIYGAIREEICHGKPDSLRNWISRCRDNNDEPLPGLSYDHLDELIAEVLQIRKPSGEATHLGPEQVFYQPTPVRHALTMIERSGLSVDDVLIDFGSGLGQLCMVASLLTGARAIGIELEAAYIDCARDCARDLRLSRLNFQLADATEADLSRGTVFHLYTPFTGSILRNILNRLQEQGTLRPLRVCTLGPCAEIVALEPWLITDAQPVADRVTVFRSAN